MTDTAASDLANTFVVMSARFRAEKVLLNDRIYAELDERYNGFRNHLLISSHSFDGDWPTWEMHPAGDEVVCLVSGDAEMILRTASGDLSTRLTQPCSFVVVPKNTWHTARIHARTTMLFITPGEGTENRESPE